MATFRPWGNNKFIPCGLKDKADPFPVEAFCCFHQGPKIAIQIPGDPASRGGETWCIHKNLCSEQEYDFKTRESHDIPK